MVGFLSKLAASVVLAAVVTDGLAAQRPVPPRPVSPTPAPARPVGVPVAPLPGQNQPGTQPGTQPGAMASCGIAAAIPFNDDPTIGTIARNGRDAREAIKTVRALDWSKTLRRAERASQKAGGKPILLVQAYGDLEGVT